MTFYCRELIINGLWSLWCVEVANLRIVVIVIIFLIFLIELQRQRICISIEIISISLGRVKVLKKWFISILLYLFKCVFMLSFFVVIFIFFISLNWKLIQLNSSMIIDIYFFLVIGTLAWIVKKLFTLLVFLLDF